MQRWTGARGSSARRRGSGWKSLPAAQAAGRADRKAQVGCPTPSRTCPREDARRVLRRLERDHEDGAQRADDRAPVPADATRARRRPYQPRLERSTTAARAVAAASLITSVVVPSASVTEKRAEWNEDSRRRASPQPVMGRGLIQGGSDGFVSLVLCGLAVRRRVRDGLGRMHLLRRLRRNRRSGRHDVDVEQFVDEDQHRHRVHVRDGNDDRNNGDGRGLKGYGVRCPRRRSIGRASSTMGSGHPVDRAARLLGVARMARRAPGVLDCPTRLRPAVRRGVAESASDRDNGLNWIRRIVRDTIWRISHGSRSPRSRWSSPLRFMHA